MCGYILYYKICIRITLVIEDLFIYIFHHVDAQGEKVNNICVLEYLVKGSAEELQLIIIIIIIKLKFIPRSFYKNMQLRLTINIKLKIK